MRYSSAAASRLKSGIAGGALGVDDGMYVVSIRLGGASQLS